MIMKLSKMIRKFTFSHIMKLFYLIIIREGDRMIEKEEKEQQEGGNFVHKNVKSTKIRKESNSFVFR